MNDEIKTAIIDELNEKTDPNMPISDKRLNWVIDTAITKATQAERSRCIKVLEKERSKYLDRITIDTTPYNASFLRGFARTIDEAISALSQTDANK
jgi:hypothetical protein